MFIQGKTGHTKAHPFLKVERSSLPLTQKVEKFFFSGGDLNLSIFARNNFFFLA